MELKLPTLAYRRVRGDMLEVYKVLSGHYNEEVCHFLPLYKDFIQNPHRVRGHTKKLLKKKPRLELRKHSFSFRVMDIWNNLPEDVVSAPSLKSFERRLDKFWTKQDIKYNYKKCIKITHQSKTPYTGTGERDENNFEGELAIEV